MNKAILKTYHGRVLVRAEETTQQGTVPGASPPPLPPPPDGGYGWVVVLAGHLLLFNTWGYTNSYALFEDYYTNTLGLSLSVVSWTGSVQIFLLLCIGTFSGRALDAGYFRVTVAIGVCLQVLSVFTTSVATEFWQLFLAQGICGGIGGGLVFCPTIAMVSTYFSRKRSLAMCLVASGTATGGVVFPVIAQQLLGRIGFGWTLRVIGFVVLFNGILGIALARPRLPPRASGPLIEWSAFSEPPYTLFTVGVFFCLWALYVAFSYITAYATDIIGVSNRTAISALYILSALGAPGRVIPAIIADRYLGPLNTLIPFILLTAALFFCWIAVHSVVGLFTFVVFFGFVDAAVQGLVLSGLPALTPELSKTGTRTGMILSCVSVATLTGGPIFGALVEAGNGSYMYAQIWGGVSMFVGAGFVIAARVAKVGWNLGKRM